MSAEALIAALRLQPHPEGGFYRETFRDSAQGKGRGASTAIYYLLRAGEISRWHRVDAAEVWHWYAGAPLELLTHENGRIVLTVLGPDVAAGDVPQAVVPAHVWQSARPLGVYALMGCTVAPAFEFSGFEMAPEGWEPG